MAQAPHALQALQAPDPVAVARSLLLPGTVQAQVRAWLQEDVPSGFDVGGFVVGGTYVCAYACGYVWCPLCQPILIDRTPTSITYTFTEVPTVAHLYGKSRGILCGVPFFDGACVDRIYTCIRIHR